MHTIQDLHRASKPRILTPEMVTVMEESLTSDDKMTARKLKNKLGEKFVELPEVSLSTIKRYRKEMGWVCTRPHYCQLIREANKLKRKEWCQKQIDNKEDFENVIFTYKCTVQLDHHRRLSFRKEKEPCVLKQQAKYLAKVHIWGGISVRGPTRTVMFTGNMNEICYGKITEAGLLKLAFLMDTVSIRIMIPSMPVNIWIGFSLFSNSAEFTGGKLHPNHRT